MFRRSSNRAFNSTRQTVCFPCSAHSIRAETSALSSDVRYTAVFIAITSLSAAAAAAKASKLVRNDSYGCCTSMSLRRISSKNRAASSTRARRGWVTGTHGSSFRFGPVDPRQLHQVCEVEQSVDLVHLVRGCIEAVPEPLQHPPRRRCRHLDADHVTEPPTPELGLDRLEQVVGVVRDLEVGVTGDPEDRLLGNLHPGEEGREEMGDHRLEWHEPLARVDEPIEPFRHLDAREPLLGRVRVDGQHPERERQARDVRERLARADRERGQHRVDLAPEHRLEPLQLLCCAVLDRHDLDSLGGERGLELARPELGLAARQLRDSAF